MKPKAVDNALTYGTFPVVFGGVMGVGVYGVAQGWSPVATVMGLTGAVVLLLLVLERVHPYQDAWLHSHDDIRTDLIHNLVNFWIPEVYAVSFVGGLTVGAAEVDLYIKLAYITTVIATAALCAGCS